MAKAGSIFEEFFQLLHDIISPCRTEINWGRKRKRVECWGASGGGGEKKLQEKYNNVNRDSKAE